MTRCIYCHLVKELDSKGRCSSCADAGDATAYGLHYGDYMAAKPRPYVLPVAITPLRELPVMKPEKSLPHLRQAHSAGERAAHPVQPGMSGGI